LLAVGSLTAVAIHVAPTLGLTDGRGTTAGTGDDGQGATDPSTPPDTTSALPPLGTFPPLAERPDPRRPFALPNALPPKAPAPNGPTPYASAPHGTTPGTGTGTARRVGDPGLSPVDLLSAPHRPTTVPATDRGRSPAARNDHPDRAGGSTTSAASDDASDDEADNEADNSREDDRGDGDDGLVGGTVHSVGSSAGTALSSLTAPLG
jgi:hypothetical protein